VKGYDEFSISPIQLMVGWFTITPMLQDLDSLAARIGQLVQFARQLQSERTALQARLKNLEQERDALRDQLHRREAEFSEMAQRIASHEAQVQALQADAEAAQATLQVETSRYKGESDFYKQKLATSQADTSRLRDVADKAKDHIDSILMRLPGAAQE
jgi:predicted  nucleic acid-binding Zn-ribbon protein